VRPGRAEPLAEALVRLARDPALRARFSGLARARGEEEFELEHTADRLRAVLRGQDPVRVPEPAVA
jgi:glycosyltransferase involved in cell wall biosynthesis